MQYHHALGMSLALLTAFIWAVVTYWYRAAGVAISPLRLNLYKGLIAGSVLALLFGWQGNLFPPYPLSVYGLLLVGGAIGIGIGDTAFFAALNRLGERHTILLAETTAPVFTIALGWLVANERLPSTTLIGSLLVLVGIAAVLSDRRRGEQSDDLNPRGIAYALVASICQAIGIVMSKLAFLQADVFSAWSAMTRIAGGTLLLIPLVLFLPTARGLRPRWTPRLARLLVSASMVGTLGGLSLQQASVKFTYSGIAQTLLASSTLFVLGIAVLLGARPSPRVWAGTALALVGIACLMLVDLPSEIPTQQTK